MLKLFRLKLLQLTLVFRFFQQQIEREKLKTQCVLPFPLQSGGGVNSTLVTRVARRLPVLAGGWPHCKLPAYLFLSWCLTVLPRWPQAPGCRWSSCLSTWGAETGGACCNSWCNWWGFRASCLSVERCLLRKCWPRGGGWLQCCGPLWGASFLPELDAAYLSTGFQRQAQRGFLNKILLLPWRMVFS